MLTATTRVLRGRLRYLAGGAAVCFALVVILGAVAGARVTAPSTVKVTGGYHVSFAITNPSDKLQCGVFRGKGYYGVLLQKVRRVKTRIGPQEAAEVSLIVQGPVGTSRLPETRLADAGFQTAAPKLWRIRPNDGVTTRFGSGTVKISANGRSGSLDAELIGQAEAAGRRSPPAPVHVTAHWHCTSKIQRATAG